MPRPRNPRLSALWISSPEQAAYEVRIALITAIGNFDEAAKILQVSRRTLFRWLQKHPEARPAPAQRTGT